MYEVMRARMRACEKQEQKHQKSRNTLDLKTTLS